MPADRRIRMRGEGAGDEAGLAVPARHRGRRRAMPSWLQVVLIFAASRVVTTVMLLALAAAQGPNPWTGAHPSYTDFASIWDGRWYDLVLTQGYPSTLPLDAAGHVAQNTWAFLPAYPWTVGAVMVVTGWPWSPAAVLVSLGFGCGAALLVHRMMARRFGGRTALFAVLLFCIGPTSPLFQLAYAESMFVFVLAAALLLLMSRRYLLLIPVAVVLSFVRPGALALALAIGLHVWRRFAVRRRDPFGAREIVASCAAAVVTALAGVAWPVIAALATGRIDAYTATELSWRAAYLGWGHLVPFAPWVRGASWWFTVMLRLPAWLGVGTLVLVVVAFALVLLLPTVRRLGSDLRFWLVSYAAYLLAVFFPQSSTFRILMPMFPLAGPLAVPRSRVYRVVLVLVMLAAQLGWLLLCWGVDGADWSPP